MKNITNKIENFICLLAPYILMFGLLAGYVLNQSTYNMVVVALLAASGLPFAFGIQHRAMDKRAAEFN